MSTHHAHTPAHSHHDPAHDSARDHGQDEEFARMIELDTVVHADVLVGVTAWLESLMAGVDVRRVLDVGAGTGAGTAALAERFPAADVVATDISPAMLERVRELADARGLASRVSTERVDIATDSWELGTFDLAWASASLHEAVDTDQAFRNLHSALRPGGLVVVVEMDDPPRMLPADLAEFEERLYAAFALARQGNAYSPDWTNALARSGFTLETRRTFTIDEPVNGGGPAGEFATLFLSRLASASATHLSPTDQEELAGLLGDRPGNLRQRSDLRLRGARTVWIARRP